MTIQCVEVPPVEAIKLWSVLQPYIERALAYDLYRSTSVPEVYKAVAEGRARVLVCGDEQTLLSATVIEKWRTAEGEDVLHVMATAGDRADDWLPQLVTLLDEIAYVERCAGITMAGRMGWLRKLKQHGFRAEVVHMRREVDEREQVEKQQQIGSI